MSSLLSRLRRVWELWKENRSDVIGGNLPGEPEIVYPLHLAELQRKQKGRFIPFIKTDPIKELVEEQP